ncbi:unnamed protein product [Blepharisma stoltei]|uniref:SAM-dependent MTase RsmB/NOP-type domain-containing protein n=1 Tax=Blepharisma stoltei TaxID=1481888 RepID=A0AAU9JRJ2_9CILI|nr:unnamed protein product [Blepharisma stoltei]
MSQIYKDGAKVLKLIKTKNIGLKGACFKLKRNVRPIYALINKILPVRKKLENEIQKKWKDCEDIELASLMLFDYWKSGKISGGGAVKHKIMEKFKPSKFLAKNLKKQKRWVIINQFKKPKNTKILGKQDEIIPDLYCIEDSAEIAKMIKNSEIISQEKASCMPVASLRLKKGNWNAIDACAAPGNKTLQLAGRMKKLSTGKIYAYELNPNRFGLLRRRIKEYRADNVKAINGDYLKAEIPKNVKVAIVDPSCSGSGIISHQLIDNGKITVQPDLVTERLKSLSYFQEKVLTKTLNIPGIQQVLYSTCSVHKIEDENVVHNVLSSFWRKFKLVKALPKWKRRGFGDYGELMVRVNPLEDKTQGFFVALIKRRSLRLGHHIIKRTHRYWSKKKHIKFN